MLKFRLFRLRGDKEQRAEPSSHQIRADAGGRSPRRAHVGNTRGLGPGRLHEVGGGRPPSAQCLLHGPGRDPAPAPHTRSSGDSVFAACGVEMVAPAPQRGGLGPRATARVCHGAATAARVRRCDQPRTDASVHISFRSGGAPRYRHLSLCSGPVGVRATRPGGLWDRARLPDLRPGERDLPPMSGR